MKKTIATAAVLAALALTGCTSGNQSATPEPTATATPSASEAVSAPASASASASASESVKASASNAAKPDAGQVWADKMINLFLNGNSKSKFADFNDELPHHYITEWGQDSEGVLKVTVKGSKWSEDDLSLLGRTIMSTAGEETESLTRVVVVDDIKSTKGEATRADIGDWN